MMDQTPTLLARLCEAETPREVQNWEGRDGYYVETCRVSKDDVPALVDVVRYWLDPDWLVDADDTLDDLEEPELLPVTAWRTLADLKDEAAVEPLIDILTQLDDEYDDWVGEELPSVFGKLGPAAIEPLTRVASGGEHQEFIRSIAVRGLRKVADYYPAERERIVGSLTELMTRADQNPVQFNSILLVELVELQAVGAAEAIERAFAADRIDVGMMGDWEQIRGKLGVEGLGLAMPERPHNSMEELQGRMGIGIFSALPVFSEGEINARAAQRYYQRAFDAFSESDEAQAFLAEHGDLGWHRSLLEFGLDYLGEPVDEMTTESVSDFLLEYIPRKVSVEAEAAATIVTELTQFWKFIDRIYQLPAAKSIVEWLQADGRVAEVTKAMSDTSKFGMAKSLVELGRNRGYDMSTPEGMSQFTEEFNRSINRVKLPAATPIPRETAHVGRNEPCPCGSGKKFKKCCGNPAQRG